MNIENNFTDKEKLQNKKEIEKRLQEIKDLLAKGGERDISNLLLEQTKLEGKLIRKEYTE